MRRQNPKWTTRLLLLLAIAAICVLCVSLGSVALPLENILDVIWHGMLGQPMPKGISAGIIWSVRLPRVICTALCGAALALSGAAMQGLLKNPLADGSTMGVSSGASLGAVIAILIGLETRNLPLTGTMLMAVLFALISLLLVLGLTFALDKSFSASTIILIGVIFSMFVNAVLSLLITFSGEKLRTITFWTMGSLSGSTFANALVLATALVIFGGMLRAHATELNAFAVGEENAHGIGVNVKRTKIIVLISVAGLIGISVAIGGTIAFVGLIVPHMMRLITGPNHRKLLEYSAFGGAVLLMLCDLIARTVLSPLELPIGVVTSLIGAVVFIVIFARSRKEGRQ